MSEKNNISGGTSRMLDEEIEGVIPQPELDAGPNLPHDSAEVFSQLHPSIRHTKKVFPALGPQEKDNRKTLMIAMLVALSVFSAWGAAYGLQYALTPHIQGHCVSPAVIESGGCFKTETSTGANGNTITTLIPAGTIGP